MKKFTENITNGILNYLKMNKLWILLLILVLSVKITTSLSQTWERTYGGADYDAARDAVQTSDGDFIIAGVTESYSNGMKDVYIVKIDGNGDTLWTKTYGGPNDDWAYSICETNDSNFVIAGYITKLDGASKNVYFLKINQNGDTLWTNRYEIVGCEIGCSVQQTNDNGFIITGYTGLGLQYDVLLVKTNSNGDTLWTRTYGSSMPDKGHSIKQTWDGGYIIAGDTEGFGATGHDVYLLKTDENGDSLWMKTFDWGCDDWGYDIQLTDDSCFIITGEKEQDVLIMKTDKDGNISWCKSYGDISTDLGFSVKQTNDNGFIIVGITHKSYKGDNDIFLIKTNVNGDTIWTKTYDYNNDSLFNGAYSILQTNDNGYLISGITQKNENDNNDMYIIKTDINGNVEFINIIAQENTLQIYPNPSNGKFNINIQKNVKEKISVNIININGKVVYSKETDNNYYYIKEKIDISNYSKGIYLLKIYSNKINITEKIIIQ